MEATHKEYGFFDSLSRMDKILNADNKQFEENDSIPARSSLTFTNGFYVTIVRKKIFNKSSGASRNII